MLLSLRDIVSVPRTAARKRRVALLPSKSQLLLLRVLKFFLITSLWEKRVPGFAFSLPAYQLWETKLNREMLDRPKPTLRGSRTGKVTWLPC